MLKPPFPHRGIDGSGNPLAGSMKYGERGAKKNIENLEAISEMLENMLKHFD